MKEGEKTILWYDANTEPPKNYIWIRDKRHALEFVDGIWTPVDAGVFADRCDNTHVVNPKDGLCSYLHRDGSIDYVAKDDIIGICVVPASHFGKARFMSLVNMSASDTSGTTSNSSMFWRASGSGTDLEVQYTVPGPTIPLTNLLNGDYTTVDTNTSGQIVSDRESSYYIYTWDSTKSYYDPDAKYISKLSGPPVYVLPSPYNADGSVSTIYKGDSTVALSDVAGAVNTAALVEKGNSAYLAARACAAFDPSYKSGEWYLPAIGELIYTQVRRGLINDYIADAIAAGSTGVLLPEADALWSSTEYDNSRVWRLHTSGGAISNNNKAYNSLVRAFLTI